MCIRDRPGQGRGAQPGVRGGGCTDTGATGRWHVNAAASGAVTHSPNAVSYTHLRAHETVLDLVCRLLLEKKKKKKHIKKKTKTKKEKKKKTTHFR